MALTDYICWHNGLYKYHNIIETIKYTNESMTIIEQVLNTLIAYMNCHTYRIQLILIVLFFILEICISLFSALVHIHESRVVERGRPLVYCKSELYDLIISSNTWSKIHEQYFNAILKVVTDVRGNMEHVIFYIF